VESGSLVHKERNTRVREASIFILENFFYEHYNQMYDEPEH
jgi:hypothetical protein